MIVTKPCYIFFNLDRIISRMLANQRNSDRHMWKRIEITNNVERLFIRKKGKHFFQFGGIFKMRHNAFTRRLSYQEEVRKIRRHTGQGDSAVIDQLGKVVRRLLVLRKSAVDKPVHKIINGGRFTRQSDLDSPANAKGIAICFILLHFAQLFAI